MHCVLLALSFREMTVSKLKTKMKQSFLTLAVLRVYTDDTSTARIHFIWCFFFGGLSVHCDAATVLETTEFSTSN